MSIRYKEKNKVLVIAELSANHSGQIDVAIETIKKAKESGADAIKLQTYTPDTITIDCDNEYFSISDGPWAGMNLYKLYEEAHTPWEWHEKLFSVARELDMICFSSPFDPSAVDFLMQFDVPYFKIASFEIQDIPLIKYAASFGKPMIMSTGIATEGDIKLAVDTCRKEGNQDITLLKCTSAYPSTIEDANLATMVDMRDRFGVDVGLSDHTLGYIVPVVAASLGAKMIEKHFILDREMGGPDAGFSMEPEEFKQMVNEVRNAERALGKVSYQLSDKVESNKMFARSLFFVKNMKEGDVVTQHNIRSIRPGNGLHPKYFDQILGKRVSKNIAYGTPVTLDAFNGVQLED